MKKHNSVLLGIDTSNYKTSVAMVDTEGNIICNYQEFLDVKKGERGLRQSNALFQHVMKLPELLEKAAEALSAEQIMVEKVSKKTGARIVNIAEGIRFCDAELCGAVLCVRAKLSCDDATFVNPRYVSEILAAAMPEVFANAEEEVCRMEVYLEDGETLFE
jgi:hypothetical protein